MEFLEINSARAEAAYYEKLAIHSLTLKRSSMIGGQVRRFDVPVLQRVDDNDKWF